MPEEHPPQGWWNQQLERRLNELNAQIDSLWKEMRDEIRRGDASQHVIKSLDDRMQELRRKLDELCKTVRDEMVSQEDFKPYRNMGALLLTLVVTGIVGALLKLVIIG